MRIITILPALLFLLLSVLAPGHILAGEVEYVPGEILVKFKDGTLEKDAGRLHANLKTEKKKELRKLKLHRMKLPSELSVEEAVRKYEQDPGVEYAEPNYIVHGLATIPADPSFSLQWSLDNNNDFDIDGPEAWDITTGSDNVIIAVIDSGLAYNHPDFATNVWTNDSELNGAAGSDDDGNNYTDDFYGWDFIDGDGYPLDLNQHGSHVSGTIAAQGNNGLGITGVMWNARIMAVRFLGLSGSGSTFDAILAIKYAYDTGARILNNSWGGGGYSQSLKDTIDIYAADALFIFSAGNASRNNDTTPMYPASFNSPNIISVAATDNSDSLVWFSNYGSASVDLAAPGVSIYSTVPQYTYGTSTAVYPVEDFEGSAGDLPLQGWDRGGAGTSWAVTNGTGVGGGRSLEDSPGFPAPGGTYARGTSVWAGYMTPLDSTAKGKRYLLSFDWKGDLELNWDWLDLVYSTVDAGGNCNNDWDWIDYRTGTQSTFISDSADYTAVAETFDSFCFGFRIESDSISDERDGAYIDNVEMTVQDITISSYSYSSFNGTSMAAPHVSGVAGLLLANNPGLTNLEIKDIILDSVDPVPGLSGLVLTGGRLNANNALLYFTPSAAPSGLTATAVSSSDIDLAWTDNSNNEDGFRIARKTGAGGTWSQIASVGPGATSFTDTGLTPSTTYYFRVRAYNTGDNSAYSNEANATTDPVNTGGGGGGGGGSGSCFIATAAYGSYLAPEVIKLRQFRDRHLLTNTAGRTFVELYYTYSPPLADMISRNGTLRAVFRAALTPIVMLVSYPNPSLLALAALLSLLLGSLHVYRKQ